MLAARIVKQNSPQQSIVAAARIAKVAICPGTCRDNVHNGPFLTKKVTLSIFKINNSATSGNAPPEVLILLIAGTDLSETPDSFQP